jgi:holliday junction DNA helicase RuvB
MWMSDPEPEAEPKHDHEHGRALSKGFRAGLDEAASRKTQRRGIEAPPPPLPDVVEAEESSFPLGNRDWFPMPETFDSFVGQDQVRLLLRCLASVTIQTNVPAPPLLLCAPRNYGKRTLAILYARELNKQLSSVHSSSIVTRGDVAGVVTSQSRNDVLLVEDIDRLPKEFTNLILIAALGDPFEITIDSGPNARSVILSPFPFTLICTCKDDSWSLRKANRRLFAYTPRFTNYTTDEIASILMGFCIRNELRLENEAALMIVRAAELNLNRSMELLRWVIAYVLGARKDVIDTTAAAFALEYY